MTNIGIFFGTSKNARIHDSKSHVLNFGGFLPLFIILVLSVVVELDNALIIVEEVLISGEGTNSSGPLVLGSQKIFKNMI